MSKRFLASSPISDSNPFSLHTHLLRQKRRPSPGSRRVFHCTKRSVSRWIITTYYSVHLLSPSHMSSSYSAFHALLFWYSMCHLSCFKIRCFTCTLHPNAPGLVVSLCFTNRVTVKDARCVQITSLQSKVSQTSRSQRTPAPSKTDIRQQIRHLCHCLVSPSPHQTWNSSMQSNS